MTYLQCTTLKRCTVSTTDVNNLVLEVPPKSHATLRLLETQMWWWWWGNGTTLVSSSNEF